MKVDKDGATVKALINTVSHHNDSLEEFSDQVEIIFGEATATDTITEKLNTDYEKLRSEISAGKLYNVTMSYNKNGYIRQIGIEEIKDNTSYNQL